ncbi:MAG: hypothetical protein SVR08_13370 [Spirochaetota bacterium]|nr:hypothetical protein [Spirochaetota bacterium]
MRHNFFQKIILVRNRVDNINVGLSVKRYKRSPPWLILPLVEYFDTLPPCNL